MNRGEVVIVDWPFTDMSGSKLRPAIVVQADFLNGLIDDTVRRFGSADAVAYTVAVHASWGICSITHQKKSVICCSIPNRLSLEAI